MDDLEESLKDITSDIPEPRRNLPEAEKDQLIRKVGGPKTAESIVKAGRELDHRRIPFLFSSLDSLAVREILVNDMTAAIAKAKSELG